MSRREPKYRLHRASGRAFISLGGRRKYLGKHGSDESLALYKSELIRLAVSKHPLFEAELHGRPRNGHVSRPPGAAVTVNELLLEYWRFAKDYYSPAVSGSSDGFAGFPVESDSTDRKLQRPTAAVGKEARKMWDAIVLLEKHCGLWPVEEFTPATLEEIRDGMIRRKLARTYINSQIGRMRRIFKWGVRKSLVPAMIFHALQAIEGLKRGRSKARETERVEPVSDVWIEATLDALPFVVRKMVELQRLTGMRSDNLTAMRACDIDRSGEIWIYEPAQHKTLHHGHRLRIPLGPRAQAIIEPLLSTSLSSFIFKPSAATEERNTKQRNRTESTLNAEKRKQLAKRRTRRRKAWRRMHHNTRSRIPRERYTSSSYGRAIARGIIRANRERKKKDPNVAEIPHWHPHQLRHTLGTEVRRHRELGGLEAAQAILGHARADVTQLYAERDLALAVRVAREIG